MTSPNLQKKNKKFILNISTSFSSFGTDYRISKCREQSIIDPFHHCQSVFPDRKREKKMEHKGILSFVFMTMLGALPG